VVTCREDLIKTVRTREDANVSERSDYFGVPAELQADGASILIDAEETTSLTLTRDGVSITVEFD